MSARNNLTVEVKIPFKGPDRNGNIYPEEVLRKTISDFQSGGKSIPFLFTDDVGFRHSIGEVRDLSMDGMELTARAVVFDGGTIDSVELNGENPRVVKSLEFLAIGVVKNSSGKDKRAILTEVSESTAEAAVTKEKEFKPFWLGPSAL